MCFLRERRILERAEAAGEQVRLRMAVRFFFRDLAFVDQTLHIGMVDRAADHLGSPEVIDARIAGVDEIAFPCRADHEGRDRAVRFFFGGDRGQLDHQVRFEHQLLERFGRVVAARRITLEQLLCGEDDLICGLAAAALAAHAIGQHAHHAARNAAVREDLHLILLIGTIAAVEPGRCRQAVAQARGAHDRKL
jgi:hypothetical protein